MKKSKSSNMNFSIYNVVQMVIHNRVQKFPPHQLLHQDHREILLSEPFMKQFTKEISQIVGCKMIADEIHHNYLGLIWIIKINVSGNSPDFEETFLTKLLEVGKEALKN